MNISSSVGQTAVFGQLSTSNVSNKPNTPIKESARSVDAAVVFETEKASNKQTTPSIVIDEQAIALFEQNQVEQRQSFASTQAQLSSQLGSQLGNESPSYANQDQPSAKNETAVATYQAVGDLAQRESVQKLFGVDLIA